MLKKKIPIIITAILAMASIGSLIPNTAYAAVSYENPIMQKALYTALYDCYMDKSAFSTEAGLADEYFDTNKRIDALKENVGGSNKKVYIPPFNDITEKISCQELLFGGKKFDGLINLSAPAKEKLSSGDMDGLLKALGYTKVVDTVKQELGAAQRCISISYSGTKDKRTIRTEYICALVNSDGTIKNDEGDKDRYGFWEDVTINGDEELTGFFGGPYDDPCEANPYNFDIGGGYLQVNEFTCSGAEANRLRLDKKDVDYNKFIDLSKIKNWEEFKSQLWTSVTTKINYETYPNFEDDKPEVLTPSGKKEQGTNGDGESESSVGKKYSVGLSFFTGDRTAKIISFLSDGKFSDQKSLKFSGSEQAGFYNALITKFFFDGKDASGYWVCEIDDSDYTQSRFWLSNENISKINATSQNLPGTNCRIDKTNAENATSKVATIKDDYFDVNGKNRKDLDGVIEELNALIESNPDAADGTIISDWDSTTDTEVSTCMNSGAIESLGWIVCPILTTVTKAVEGFYDSWIEPALNVSPELFNQGGTGSSTYGAWQTFRNFANIIFIILFLFVIFSQLTGFGIDNYGIKKILPKLIVVAILVNLSYIICQIAIDLSNIFGNGLQDLFKSLPVREMKENAASVIGESKANEVGSTLLTAIPIVGGLMLVGSAVWKNPAVLLSLLVSALGLFVAVIFLFAILSAREAAIVVFTVISPVAFVCYALPNTKNLFDKWFKIGKGLLLVYPICGLLMGGGNYVSRLLLVTAGGENFLNAFMAIIVGIVPIFFIPTVLKGSFAALGNLGAKISGLATSCVVELQKELGNLMASNVDKYE